MTDPHMFELVLPDGASEHRGLLRASNIQDSGDILVECTSPLHTQLTRYIADNGWPNHVVARFRDPDEAPEGVNTRHDIRFPRIELRHGAECEHEQRRGKRRHPTDAEGRAYTDDKVEFTDAVSSPGEFVGDPTSLYLKDLHERQRDLDTRRGETLRDRAIATSDWGPDDKVTFEEATSASRRGIDKPWGHTLREDLSKIKSFLRGPWFTGFVTGMGITSVVWWLLA